MIAIKRSVELISVLCFSVLFACASQGRADSSDISSIEQPRIVAVGDVHGDFEQFEKLLSTIGVVDNKGRWAAGKTQLVQLGDIPDRGPDSRKTIDYLRELQKQAQAVGGAVHVLIGNHEAMMMIGDLRYVHAGEYAAFKDRNSKARRKAYYQQTIDHIKATTAADQWPEFDKAYRKAWEARFPLGYVEHRIAWSPSGEYGQWVLSNSAVLKLGDTLFVHGGLSPDMQGMSITDINTRVRTALAEGEAVAANSIIESPTGPLWDRGWVTRLQNEANEALLDSVLAAYDTKRMVIAHTPIAPIIVPRFNGKILMADVGLSAHYGHGFAALEIIDGQSFALLGQHRIKLPDNNADFDAYFDTAAAAVKDPAKIIRYRELVAEAEQREEQKEQQKANQDSDAETAIKKQSATQ